MGLPIESDEEETMQKMDADGSGTLERPEWVEWWIERVSKCPNPGKQQEVIARNVFQKFDRDNSGLISIEEFQDLVEYLGADFSSNELLAAISELDEDNSGQLDCNEFVRWWTNKSAASRPTGGLIAKKLKKLANKAMY
jgi:Ca2+-binding EF-hand superfamily protein